MITVCTAFAWRKVLKDGVGATWYPILRGLEGLGLIVDGFFSQDPAPGYPQGAVLTAPTLHGEIHLVFAFVTITALAFSCFVLARRFAGEPNWRGWAAYSVITGLLTIVLIATFGAESAHAAPTAGLLERLATGVDSLWGFLLLARLWAGTGFVVSQRQGSSHAHSYLTCRPTRPPGIPPDPAL